MTNRWFPSRSETFRLASRVTITCDSLPFSPEQSRYWARTPVTGLQWAEAAVFGPPVTITYELGSEQFSAAVLPFAGTFARMQRVRLRVKPDDETRARERLAAG
jgi:hypothetical protein